jgi:hypothetical protein
MPHRGHNVRVVTLLAAEDHLPHEYQQPLGHLTGVFRKLEAT